jgi:hypothetical protein
VCSFGVELAEEFAAQGRSADLLIGNNVLHQVPDLDDSVSESNLLMDAAFFALRRCRVAPSRRVTSAPA